MKGESTKNRNRQTDKSEVIIISHNCSDAARGIGSDASRRMETGAGEAFTAAQPSHVVKFLTPDARKVTF